MAKTIDFESVNEQQTQVNNEQHTEQQQTTPTDGEQQQTEQQTPSVFTPGSRNWFKYGAERRDDESSKQFSERIEKMIKEGIGIDGEDDVKFESIEDLEKSVSALKSWLNGYVDMMNAKAKMHFDRLIRKHPSYDNVMKFTDNLKIYYTKDPIKSKKDSHIKSELVTDEKNNPLYMLYQYKANPDIMDVNVSYDTYSRIWEQGLEFYKDRVNIERTRKENEAKALEQQRTDELRKQLQILNDEALALAMSGDIEGAQKIIAKIKVIKEILGIKD